MTFKRGLQSVQVTHHVSATARGVETANEIGLVERGVVYAAMERCTAWVCWIGVDGVLDITIVSENENDCLSFFSNRSSSPAALTGVSLLFHPF